MLYAFEKILQISAVINNTVRKIIFVVTFTYRSSKNFHHLQPPYLDLLHHVPSFIEWNPDTL